MKTRANGKVILLGEHAVVYGFPALAVGITRGASAWFDEGASARNDGSGGPWLVLEGFTEAVAQTDPSEVGRAFSSILCESGAALDPGAVLHVSTELPPGGGLGCSAALGVAIARALEPRANDARVMHLAMEWEKIFHGNPSGVDAAVAAHGGCVLFRKGQALKPIHQATPLRLVVGHSGVSSSTKHMVDKVAMRWESDRANVNKLFERMGALTEAAASAVERGELKTLGDSMTEAGELLSAIGLSTPALDQMCNEARKLRALGVKLTGAGGGGCAVALVDNIDVENAIVQSWTQLGFASFATEVAQTKRWTETPESIRAVG